MGLKLDERLRGLDQAPPKHWMLEKGSGFVERSNRVVLRHRAAAQSGDDLLGLRADLEDAGWRFLVDSTANEASLLALADRVYALAEARGNTSGLVRAEMTRAEVHLGHCRWMDDLAAVERARALLGPNDDPRLGARVRADMGNALRYGPVPAVEAIDRIEALSRESGDSNLLIFTSALFAMLGQFEEARSRFSATRTYLEDRGLLRLGHRS